MDETAKIVSNLRDIIISVEGGLNFGQLRHDYLNLYGAHINDICAGLGYRSVETLVTKHPADFNVAQGRVFAIAKASTAHIQKFVNENKKKRRGRYTFSKPNAATFAPVKAYVPQPRYPPRLRFQKLPAAPIPNLFAVQPVYRNAETEDTRLLKGALMDLRKLKVSVPCSSGSGQDTNGNADQAVVFTHLKAKEPSQRETYRHVNELINSVTEDEDFFTEIPSLTTPELKQKGPSKPRSNTQKQPIPSNGLSSAPVVHKINYDGDANGNDDILSRLFSLCALLDIPDPESKTCTSSGNDNKANFSCLLRVNNKIYHGGPVESNIVTARNIAASQAYMDLKGLLAKQSFEEKFLTLLYEMVLNKPSGIWLECIPSVYKEAYKTPPLPSDWETYVNKSEKFVVVNILGKQVVKAVVIPNKTIETDNITPNSSTPQQTAKALFTDCPGVSPVMHDDITILQELKFEKNVTIDVSIIEFPSKDCVIVRLVNDEYIEKLDNMTTEMELNLLDKKCHQAEFPEVGEYYGVFLDKAFHRVILKKTMPDSMGLVYTIDSGNQATVPLTEFYLLQQKYYDLPPQALRFRLEGLANFPDFDGSVSTMAPKTTVSVVGLIKDVFETTDEEDPIGSIELYDTSVDPNINLNLDWMERAVSNLSPILSVLDSTYDMIATEIVENALYVKINDNSVECISSLIEYVASKFEVDTTKVKKIVVDKVYVAMHPKTKTLQRIQIIAVAENFEVLFIDIGETAEISRDQVYDFLTPRLQKVPARAIKVALMDVDTFSAAMESFLKNQIVGSAVWVRSKMRITMPHVEIYWRDPKTVALQCINKMLETFPACPMTDIPDPEIPVVESMVFLTVTLSINPSSFKVRLRDERKDFIQLMDDLQIAGLENKPVPDYDCLKAGKCVAVKSDNSWYRGKLQQVLGIDKYSVQLIDIGSTVLPSRNDLRELPARQLKYPVLLHQASLHGVKASLGDWSPSDCVFFQNLVADKELAAVIKDVTFLDDGKHVLHVFLIDTSDEDVYINEQLSENKIGVLI